MEPFIPYGRQSVDDSDIAAVTRVLRSQFLTQGPEVERFEQLICEHTGALHAVAVASATAGLHMAAAALQLSPGLEGITSPITFLASANCMIYNGLIPRFADIRQDTYNIDPVSLAAAISDRTAVAIPVHFAGQAADMESIAAVCARKGVHVVEDAAHAIGSRYRDGSPVGNCRYSVMTVFSFHPVKTMTTGEGGAITTNDTALFERLKMLRSHGVFRDFHNDDKVPGPWYHEMRELGFNYRLTDIQAALGASQILKLERFVARRREIVQKYNAAFQNVEWLTIPFEESGVVSAFHLYVLKVDFSALNSDRAHVMEALREKGIGTQVHYIPVYLQPYYRRTFGYASGLCPRAEEYYSRALSIPLFPAMTDAEVDRVIRCVLSLADPS
jgi:UDP-4-amino-4,6-dideoxy-N-acetyl-beta-L-altrosamine transaminase